MHVVPFYKEQDAALLAARQKEASGPTRAIPDLTSPVSGEAFAVLQLGP